MDTYKHELLRSLYEADIYKRVACTKEEVQKFECMKQQDLPEDVFIEQMGAFTQFFRVVGPVQDASQMKVLLEVKKLECMNKQTKYIYTIKNCLVFFVVLVLLSLGFGLIGLMNR